MDDGSLSTILLWTVVAARLLVPLAIPRFPLPGIVAALVLDGVDQTVFQVLIGGDLPGYQTYDKALDVYYLAVAYLSTIRNWADGWAFRVGRGLWYWRLVGVALFEATGERWLLLVFPNTFEYYFIALELVRVAWNAARLSRNQITALAAGIWIFIKLPQEWWIHIAQLDVTDVLKEHVFGVPLSASWTDALANRPIVLVVGAAILIGLAVLALRARRHLPDGDWPPTLSSDVQGRGMGWDRPARRAAAWAAVDRRFVEKVILVTLVSAIFGRILPGAERNLVQVATATTLVVGASTAISWLFTRAGGTWWSAAAQFVTIGTTNAVTVVALGILLPYRGERPLVTALFLVGLVTLIVVSYDRFTATRRFAARASDAVAARPH